jgi:hypothetical protein
MGGVLFSTADEFDTIFNFYIESNSISVTAEHFRLEFSQHIVYDTWKHIALVVRYDSTLSET